MIGPVAAGVDHSRDELLAGAAFAGQEDRGLERRDPGDEVEHLTRCRRVSDEELPGRRPARLIQQAAILLLEPLPLAGQLLQVSAVLDGEAAEPRERDQKPRILVVEDRLAAAPFLVRQDEHSCGTGASLDGHPDRRRNRRSQKTEILSAQGALRRAARRSRTRLAATTSSEGRRAKPTRASARRAPPSPNVARYPRDASRTPTARPRTSSTSASSSGREPKDSPAS